MSEKPAPTPEEKVKILLEAIFKAKHIASWGYGSDIYKILDILNDAIEQIGETNVL